MFSATPEVEFLARVGRGDTRVVPQEGLHACSHAESVLVDGKVLMAGPTNATHNGLERNYDVVVKVRGPRL